MDEKERKSLIKMAEKAEKHTYKRRAMIVADVYKILANNEKQRLKEMEEYRLKELKKMKESGIKPQNPILQRLEEMDKIEEMKEKKRETRSKSMKILDIIHRGTAFDKEVDVDYVFSKIAGTRHQLLSILDYLEGRKLIYKRFTKMKSFPRSSKLYLRPSPSGIWVLRKKFKEKDDFEQLQKKVEIIKENKIDDGNI